MKNIPVKFKNGYELTLHFTMGIWERMENEICMIGDVGDRISQGKDRLRTSARIAALMSDDAAVTEETIWANMEPRDVRALNQAIMEAVAENLAMETAQEDEGEVHDVILEEIEAKKEPAG